MGNSIHRTAISDYNNPHIGIAETEAEKNHRSNSAQLNESHALLGLEIWMMLLTSIGLWIGIFFIVRFAWRCLIRFV